SPEDVSFSEDYRPRDITVCNTTNASQKRKSSTPGPEIQQKRRLAEDTTLSELDTSLFQFRDRRTEVPSEVASVQPARMLADGDTMDLVDEEAEEEAMLLAVSDAVETSQIPRPSSTEVCFFNTEDAPPTLLPEDNNEEDESIPQSPERERGLRVRTIFSRCFQNTYVPREPSPNSQVYAPNSDTED
ncbi:PREDICTED: uncharacterized protein LOC108612353, partial [Drosophila arizonae]|uniref:Uncharacterized protein LOC108612353 n=1 Tax=Drosophila arizonae TaxID=7263 RepID=A0ABM1P0I4_DROAR